MHITLYGLAKKQHPHITLPNVSALLVVSFDEYFFFHNNIFFKLLFLVSVTENRIKRKQTKIKWDLYIPMQ